MMQLQYLLGWFLLLQIQLMRQKRLSVSKSVQNSLYLDDNQTEIYQNKTQDKYLTKKNPEQQTYLPKKVLHNIKIEITQKLTRVKIIDKDSEDNPSRPEWWIKISGKLNNYLNLYPK